MRLSDWRATTRQLFGLFLRELPIMAGIWLVVAVGLAVYGYLQGEPLADAIRTGLVFLPMAIPLSPLIWLRHEPKACKGGALPAMGLGCLWAVVTLPLAAGLAVAIDKLLGAA